MRILVICVPRSGTTSFLNSLSKVKNIPLVCLPDNYEYPTHLSLIENTNKFKSIILRIVPTQNIGMSILEFSKKFDLTIFMTRREQKEHLESFINVAYQKNILQSTTPSTPSSPDSLYDYSSIPESFITEFLSSNAKSTILQAREQIYKLSKEMSGDILFYEDLYFGNNQKGLLSKFLSFNSDDIDRIILELRNTKKLRIVPTKSLL